MAEEPAEPPVPPGGPPPAGASGHPNAVGATARPAAAETLAAGFTHRDAEQGARGFAAGGPLDAMEPGQVLAGFAAGAVDDGLGGLSDDELIGLMCAARRMSSWSASIELGAVSQLGARRAAHAAATGNRRQADHVADEVAVALTLTCRAADRLVSLAAGVTRLPAVAAALAAGRIDVPKAVVFCDELAGLGDVAAAAIAAVAIRDAVSLTTGELRQVLHRAVLAHDPEAAKRRREKAQKDARVEAWAESRGTAALAGRDMPPADVLAADKRIDAIARELKAAGAEGTLEQLRAKVFIALLTSRPLYTLLPGNNPSADSSADDGTDSRPADGCEGASAGSGSTASAAGSGSTVGTAGGGSTAGTADAAGTAGTAGGEGGDSPAQDDDNGDDSDDVDGGGGGGCRRPGPGTGPRGGAPGTAWPTGPGFAAGLTGSVNLTIPLATWLGLSGQPGEAAGHGPLDAVIARDLAAAIAARPGNSWCLTITGPDGRATGHGCARTGPPASTGSPGQRAGTGRNPGAGPGPPASTGPSASTGPPGTGPPGQRAGAGHNAGARPGPSGCDPGAWLAGIKIRWLETGACGHARETVAYQPSPVLRHLVKTRDRTCSFPGCRWAARRCDDDHTMPFDQGGRTCECNLAPLCRRHHAAKQAPGWHLRQSQPGHLIWALPSGRTRTVTPRTYAA